MSLSNINWNGKSNNAQVAGQQIIAGPKQITVNVPTIATSGACSPGNFSYQITVNGAGIFPIPVAPKSEADIAKENADAFDRAMGIVG